MYIYIYIYIINKYIVIYVDMNKLHVGSKEELDILHSPSESPFVEHSTHPKKSMNIFFFEYHLIFFVDCLHESMTQSFLESLEKSDIGER
jgi:hypothetical protein